jgi:phospholipid-binding lipoprotein MlaA
MYRAALAALLLLNLGLSGCAALPTGKPDPRDRFERFNRSIYKFNTALDHAVLRPVAKAYVKVLPQPVRNSIGNFTTNLAYPSTVANDFFQGKVADGVSDAARIVVNSTIGIGGLFDPASHMGLERHTQDFGLTLGRWGVPSGPYLMLPLLGPSTVRDTVGLVPDYVLIYEIVSTHLITNNYAIWGLYGLAQIDRRARLLDLDKIVDSAYDPYAFTRSAYLQQRDYLIRGEENPEEMFPDADTDSSDDKSAAPPAQTPK